MTFTPPPPTTTTLHPPFSFCLESWPQLACFLLQHSLPRPPDLPHHTDKSLYVRHSERSPGPQRPWGQKVKGTVYTYSDAHTRITVLFLCLVEQMTCGCLDAATAAFVRFPQKQNTPPHPPPPPLPPICSTVWIQSCSRAQMTLTDLQKQAKCAPGGQRGQSRHRGKKKRKRKSNKPGDIWISEPPGLMWLSVKDASCPRPAPDKYLKVDAFHAINCPCVSSKRQNLSHHFFKRMLRSNSCQKFLHDCRRIFSKYIYIYITFKCIHTGKKRK